MSIKELLEAAGGANITLAVTPADLKEFAMEIIEETKEMIKAEKKPEEYLTPKQVMKIFEVSGNTLWRWNRDKYLCTVKLGRKNFYRKSDVLNLLEQKR